MANNYLITGYWGEPHVTVENDRGINAAIFGAGRWVLPVGNQFRAEYIGDNTVRVYDGKLIDNGAVAGIPAGQYVDLLIPEAGQGKKRNDIIAFQYSKDAATLIESGTFVVIKGTETSGTASDPELTHQDILSDTATFDQMALWRVSVSSTVISAPVQLFEVHNSTFEINVTENGDSFKADKTFAEILTAYNHGKTFTLSYLGYKCHLANVDVNEHFAFSSPTDSGFLTVAILESNNVDVVFDSFAAAAHSHSANSIIGGTFGSKVNANATAAATVGTAQVRDIYAGTSDMSAGSSALTTGALYFVYE